MSMLLLPCRRYEQPSLKPIGSFISLPVKAKEKETLCRDSSVIGLKDAVCPPPAPATDPPPVTLNKFLGQVSGWDG